MRHFALSCGKDGGGWSEDSVTPPGRGTVSRGCWIITLPPTDVSVRDLACRVGKGRQEPAVREVQALAPKLGHLFAVW